MPKTTTIGEINQNPKKSILKRFRSGKLTKQITLFYVRHYLSKSEREAFRESPESFPDILAEIDGQVFQALFDAGCNCEEIMSKEEWAKLGISEDDLKRIDEEGRFA